MWPTIDGMRTLKGSEADLARGAIAMMLDHLVSEFNEDAETWHYGIDLFDMWDCDQRIWLLEQVTAALLTRRAPLPTAAIWEATVDAIFFEVFDQVSMEYDGTSDELSSESWAQSVSEAFVQQQGRKPSIDPDDATLEQWRLVVTQVADAILGPTSYDRAEPYRDIETDRLLQFLRDRGLPDNYLDAIPPLRSVGQTQRSVERIGSLVTRRG